MAYVSEHTKFMQEWLEKHPEQIEEQKKGRALWWDKPQDVATQAEYTAAKVPTRSYYYQTEH